MQSALELELRNLLFRLRNWLFRHDRAVLFGVALCCVPFPPANLLGLGITVVNLLLVRAGRLDRSEVPLLLAGCGMVALYVLLWWLAFTTLGAGFWHGFARTWNGFLDFLPLRPRGLMMNV